MPKEELFFTAEEAVRLYEKNIDEIIEHTKKYFILGTQTRLVPLSCACKISDEKYFSFWLSISDIASILRTLPSTIKEKSGLEKIIGKPELWIEQGSSLDSVQTTKNEKKAISPYNFVVSGVSIDYVSDDVTSSTISLYKIPHFIDRRVGRMLHLHGFMHNYAKTIIEPMISQKKKSALRFMDGKMVLFNDFFQNFKNEVVLKFPISIYTEMYREKNNTFKKNFEEKGPVEEFAECNSAFFLGYACTKNEQRFFDAFKDRPDIVQMIENFIYSKRI